MAKDTNVKVTMFYGNEEPKKIQLVICGLMKREFM